MGIVETHAETRTHFTNPVGGPAFDQEIARGQGDSQGVRLGYALGGGVEWSLTPRWSLALDYLYYSVADKVAVNVEGVAPYPSPGTHFDVNADLSGHMARLSVNYQLTSGL